MQPSLGYRLRKSVLRLYPYSAQLIQSRESLHRAHHTLNVIEGKAFIFGGKVDSSTVAGNEVHILNLLSGSSNLASYEYKCVPASTVEESDQPPGGRFGHASTAIDGSVYVFGGHDGASVISESDYFWRFDSRTFLWSRVDSSSDAPAPEPRSGHAVVSNHHETIVIHGGTSSEGEALTDTWAFDLGAKTWRSLPESKSFTNITPPNLALIDETLYLVDHTAKEETVIHSLSIHEHDAVWQSVTIPAQVSSPSPRQGASLMPVSTGMGRQYLLYMLGEKMDPSESSSPDDPGPSEFWSGLWTYQIDSAEKSLARIKDVTKDKLGMDSERATWAEVEIQPSTEEGSEGKSHPGPRGYFAVDGLDAKTVVLWGGVNAKEMIGDGWLVTLR